MTSWRQQINTKVTEPASIHGLPNGQFPDTALVAVRNGDGVRIGRLCPEAARAWTAMVAKARDDGVVLDATDTYRTLQVQRAIFIDRYRETNQGNGSRKCGGKTWWLRVGKATAACPGTSNHGWGLAIDNRFHGTGLRWLEANAKTYGWQWEVPSEDWHIHYFPGDHIPQAVLDFEAHPTPPEEDDMKMTLYQPDFGPDKGMVFLVGPVSYEYIGDPKAESELERQWGKPVQVNAVAWDHLKSGIDSFKAVAVKRAGG